MIKDEHRISDTISKCINKLHAELGYGLLERIYFESLIYELKKNGLTIYRNKEMIVRYERIRIKTYDTIDLLIDNKVALMIKKKSEPEDIFNNKVQTLFRLSKYNPIIILDFSTLEPEYLLRGVNTYS